MKIEILYEPITSGDWKRLGVEWPSQNDPRYTFESYNSFRKGWKFEMPEGELIKIADCWHEDLNAYSGINGGTIFMLGQFSFEKPGNKIFNVEIRQNEIIEAIKNNDYREPLEKENEIIDWCQENVQGDFILSLRGKYKMQIFSELTYFGGNKCALIFGGFIDISFTDDASAMAYKLRWDERV